MPHSDATEAASNITVELRPSPERSAPAREAAIRLGANAGAGPGPQPSLTSRAPQDRRRATRHKVDRPCKVFVPGAYRWYPGRTLDVSSGGALVVVQCARPFQIGEMVDVGIAFAGEPVVSDRATARGMVVRAVGTETLQSLAIQFAGEIAIAAAA
ncbi:MAG: PilZ domain-containing protein [Planctomycetota bacterium]|nr:PilZ domain-containing protein [Planctomycetota bacterium]